MAKISFYKGQKAIVNIFWQHRFILVVSLGFYIHKFYCYDFVSLDLEYFLQNQRKRQSPSLDTNIRIKKAKTFNYGNGRMEDEDDGGE